MVFAFCGLPSAHSIFVARLGADMLREMFGDVDFVHSNAASDLIDRLKPAVGRPCLVYFDRPEPRLADHVAANGIPTIVVTEPFQDAVCYCMAAWDLDLNAAIRFVVQSAVALYPVSSSSTIAPVGIARGQDLTHLINTIALALGLQPTGDAIRALVAHYAAEEPAHAVVDLIDRRIDHAADARQRRANLSAEESVLLDTMARNYQPIVEGKPVTEMNWPAAMCTSGDKPNGPAGGFMAMTGPARILTFGPYLNLPAGKWRADMRFSVSRNVSGNIIMADIVIGGTVRAAGRAELPPNGQYAVSLTFEVTQPESPIEMRGSILAGAIEGEFQLLDIVMTNLEPG